MYVRTYVCCYYCINNIIVYVCMYVVIIVIIILLFMYVRMYVVIIVLLLFMQVCTIFALRICHSNFRQAILLRFIYILNLSN